MPEMKLFGWKVSLNRLFGLDSHPEDPGDPEIDKTGDVISNPLMTRQLYDSFESFMRIEQERRKRYNAYREMDKTDLVASVADLYAEDATTPNPDTGRTLWAESPNAQIRDALEKMIRGTRAEDFAFAIAREICLMGDDFERTIYRTTDGIRAFHWQPPDKIQRRDDKYRRLQGFMQDGKTFRKKAGDAGRGQNNMSYAWDYIHFHSIGRFRNENYGTSMFHNAIRPWRQILLAEDEALLYRLNRHPDRLVWKIDVGQLPEEKAMKSIHRFRKRIRKQEYVDPASGKYDHERSPMTPIDDIFLGIRKGSETNVDKLPGSENAGEITDLRYYIDKFFSAVRAPKIYFGFESQESSSSNPKQVLTNQNVRYARSVQRLQRAYIMGIREMAMIHLTLLNPVLEESAFNWTKKGNEFQIVMEPVSYLAELERLELYNLRATAASTLQGLSMGGMGNIDTYIWTKFIFKDILRVPPDMLAKLIKKSPPMGAGMPGMPAAGTPEGDEAGGDEEEGKKELDRVANAKDVENKEEATAILVEATNRNPELLRLLRVGRELFMPQLTDKDNLEFDMVLEKTGCEDSYEDVPTEGSDGYSEEGRKG